MATRSRELQSRLESLEKEKGQLNNELSDTQSHAARIANEREQLRQEQARLAATLDQERIAKEGEIARLTRTQEELSKSLQDEISKGNITIQQVRDRLTINMVDRVLFDSGQAQAKPAGAKVLKQVSDILKTVTDKQIRIEGHTDNVPISSKLQDRFKTNWNSRPREPRPWFAISSIKAAWTAGIFPQSAPQTHSPCLERLREGRSSNRRIEIVLYPTDLKDIAGQAEISTASSK